jgi:hypothetical protein
MKTRAAEGLICEIYHTPRGQLGFIIIFAIESLVQMMSLVSRNILTARKARRHRPVVVANRLTASRLAKIGFAFALGVMIAAAAAKMLYLLAA